MTDIYDLKKLKLKFLCFSVSVERRMHYLKINFSDFFFISLIFVKESIKNVSQGLISRNEKFGFARAYFAKREIWLRKGLFRETRNLVSQGLFRETRNLVLQGLISRNEKFGFARAYFAKREIRCALLYSQVHQSCNSFSLFGSFLVRNYY